MENSRNKQFVTVILHIVLSHMIKSCAADSCYPGHESSLCSAISSTRHLVAMLSVKLSRYCRACVQSVSSVAQSCLTLCDLMDSITPGFPVHHQLPEPAEIHLHWVGDAIQPSHPLSSPSVFNLSQHQGLFQLVSSLHQVDKVLEFQFQQQSFQWIFRTDFL